MGENSMSTKKKDPQSVSITGENVVGFVHADHQATVDISQSSKHTTGDADFEKLFALLEEKIQARPADPNVDKEEIQGQVKQIKTEAAKGESANPDKLDRWIHNLARMAPDIFEVMVASLAGPVAGLSVVIQKIAVRVKAELEHKG
jgi:hypothetical protein